MVLDKIDKEKYFIFGAGFLFFFLAIATSVVFAEERNLGDAAWRLFFMINTEGIVPSHRRWVLVFVQFLPVFGIKMEWSLRSIMTLHSIGMPLLFLGLSLAALMINNGKYLVLALILAFILGAREVHFFYPDLEMLLQSGFILFLGFYLMQLNQIKLQQIFFISFLLFSSLFGHPTGLISLSFILTLVFLEKGWKFCVPIFLLLLIFLVLRVLSMDVYEISRSNQFSNEKQLINLSQTLKLITANWTIFLVFNLTFCYLLFTRRWLKSGLFILFVFGYLLLTFLLADSSHYEAYLSSLLTGVVFVFIFELQMKLSGISKQALIFLVLLLSIVESNEVLKAANQNTQKVRLHKRTIEQMHAYPTDRAWAHESNLYQFCCSGNNGYSYAETMLISSLKGPENAKAIVPLESSLKEIEKLYPYFGKDALKAIFPEELNAANDDSLSYYLEAFFAESYMNLGFKMWFHEELNEKYFQLDNPKFRPLNAQVLHQHETGSIKLTTKINKSKTNGDHRVILLGIDAVKDKLFSWKENELLVFAETISETEEKTVYVDSSLLEVDVTGHYVQPIKIFQPRNTDVRITVRQDNQVLSNQLIIKQSDY